MFEDEEEVEGEAEDAGGTKFHGKRGRELLSTFSEEYPRRLVLGDVNVLDADCCPLICPV